MKDTQSVKKTYYVYEIDVNRYIYMHRVRDIIGEQTLVFSVRKFPANYFILFPYKETVGKSWGKLFFINEKRNRPNFINIKITKFIGPMEVWYSNDIINLPSSVFSGIYFYKEMTFRFMYGINGGNFGKAIMECCLNYYINEFFNKNENLIDRL